MIWFTGDTHLGHKNILDYCSRPYKDIREHDEAIRDNWNEVVAKGDIVYHLGDLAFLRGSRIRAERLAELINGLNGKIKLILGNHDKAKHIKKYGINVELLGAYYELTVQDSELKNQLVVLCHYPFATWNKRMWGSWNLHGHVHSKDLRYRPGQLDVGVDARNFTPVSLQTVKTIFTRSLLTTWSDPEQP